MCASHRRYYLKANANINTVQCVFVYESCSKLKDWAKNKKSFSVTVLQVFISIRTVILLVVNLKSFGTQGRNSQRARPKSSQHYNVINNKPKMKNYTKCPHFSFSVFTLVDILNINGIKTRTIKKNVYEYLNSFIFFTLYIHIIIRPVIINTAAAVIMRQQRCTV